MRRAEECTTYPQTFIKTAHLPTWLRECRRQLSRELPGSSFGMLQFLQGLPELFSLSRSSGSSNTGLLVKFCLVNGDRQLISNALQQFNRHPWVEGSNGYSRSVLVCQNGSESATDKGDIALSNQTLAQRIQQSIGC